MNSEFGRLPAYEELVAVGIPVYEGISNFSKIPKGLYIPSFIGTKLPMNDSDYIINTIHMQDDRIHYREVDYIRQKIIRRRLKPSNI